MTDVLTRLTAALTDRYAIQRELGAGGMATVYLAHDIKHDRDVAIKVLHADLGAALGAERFLTEIRTTARLQHPHILPLLDSGDADGLLYYVMPLVTGETLRARLDREQQLPVADAVLIAREVADALGHAHGLGVIHRDIKPENILLQGSHALVADFGIALAVQQAGGQRMTQTGLSLGTPQYMSPEQAMGERVIDARSDLYALGAVTYEMLVGEAPFTGPTVQAIVARLVQEEPRGIAGQRKAVPEHVDHAVLRALEKLPADRWATAREFADALQGTSEGGATRSAPGLRRPAGAGSSRPRLRDPIVLGLAVVAVAGIVAAVWARRAPTSPSGDVVRFTIPAASGGGSNSLGFGTLAVSSDGRKLVYIGERADRQQQLMLRDLDEIVSHPIDGTEDASGPIFSPDGKWVAFIRGNQVFKVPVTGGRPQMLGTAPGTFNGMTWSATGVIIASGNIGLFTIPEGGGAATPFTESDRSVGEVYQDAPVAVDEEGIVLFSSWRGSASTTARIAMATLATGEVSVLDAVGTQPIGIVDGVLMYVNTTGALMGVPIDVKKRRVTGEPVQLATDVSINNGSGLASAALSRTGTLFYQSGTRYSQVVEVSASSEPKVILGGEAQEYLFPRLSPDANRLAVTVGNSERRDVWLYDLRSLTPTRITTEGAANERPEWSPDGKRVLYRTDRDVRTAIWWRPADLSAAATPLLTGDRLDVFEAVLSPDGRNIVFQLDTLGADILFRGLSGDTTAHVIANNPQAIETMPRLSPDGRWVAFVTDESGRAEVVVQPFPGPGGRVQVSAAGGTEPVWSRDGARLFYRGDGKVLAATMRISAPALTVARRDTLFFDKFLFASNPHANYDVMPDGKRFLFLKGINAGDIIVAANWRVELRAKMAEAVRE